MDITSLAIFVDNDNIHATTVVACPLLDLETHKLIRQIHSQGSNLETKLAAAIQKATQNSTVQTWEAVNGEILTNTIITTEDEDTTSKAPSETKLDALIEQIDLGAVGVIYNTKTPDQVVFFGKKGVRNSGKTAKTDFVIEQQSFSIHDLAQDNAENVSKFIAVNDITLHRGNCLSVMQKMQSESIDAIVTDPPYEIGFGGNKWDSSGIAYDVELWKEALRVLKPGGYLLAFGGTRMWHRVAVAIEDAGFEIKDNIAWMFGSGFPKTMNVGLSMEKHFDKLGEDGTEDVDKWSAYGTAIKPAFEPIVMARKPLSRTIVETLLEHSTGALHIDAARIPTTDKLGGGSEKNGKVAGQDWKRPWMEDPDAIQRSADRTKAKKEKAEELGRYPSNVILDEAQAVALDIATTETYDAENPKNNSRFFYIAKTNRKDNPEINGYRHATVKPVSLMEQLVKLVTPEGGVVLDMFAGSGSTLEAAHRSGVQSIGIELDPDGFHIPLILHRIRSMEDVSHNGSKKEVSVKTCKKGRESGKIENNNEVIERTDLDDMQETLF